MKNAAQCRAAARALNGNKGPIQEVTDRQCAAVWAQGQHVHLPQNPHLWKGREKRPTTVPTTHKEALKQQTYNRLYDGTEVEYHNGNIRITVQTKKGKKEQRMLQLALWKMQR